MFCDDKAVLADRCSVSETGEIILCSGPLKSAIVFSLDHLSVLSFHCLRQAHQKDEASIHAVWSSKIGDVVDKLLS